MEKYSGAESKERTSKLILKCAMIIGFIIALMIVISAIKRQNDYISKVKTLENDKEYVCYFNGQKIDIDTVDLMYYKITLDEENKVAKLTR